MAEQDTVGKFDAQNASRRAVRRKRPYVFAGSIGTAQIKPFEGLFYTSLFIANDSGNIVYYDISGSGFQILYPNEQHVFDLLCRSNDFTVYASAVSTNVRITLWNAEQ